MDCFSPQAKKKICPEKKTIAPPENQMVAALDCSATLSAIIILSIEWKSKCACLLATYNIK